jgi:hypothetical protein
MKKLMLFSIVLVTFSSLLLVACVKDSETSAVVEAAVTADPSQAVAERAVCANAIRLRGAAGIRVCGIAPIGPSEACNSCAFPGPPPPPYNTRGTFDVNSNVTTTVGLLDGYYTLTNMTASTKSFSATSSTVGCFTPLVTLAPGETRAFHIVSVSGCGCMTEELFCF